MQDIARVAIHPLRRQDGRMEAVRIETARAALNRGARERASVAVNTVTRIGDGADAGPSTIGAPRRAIEAAGVRFIARGGEGLHGGVQPS